MHNSVDYNVAELQMMLGQSAEILTSPWKHHLYIVQHLYNAVCIARLYPCPDINEQGRFFFLSYRWCLYWFNPYPQFLETMCISMRLLAAARCHLWPCGHKGLTCEDAVLTQASGLIIILPHQLSQPTRNNLFEPNI